MVQFESAAVCKVEIGIDIHHSEPSNKAALATIQLVPKFHAFHPKYQCLLPPHTKQPNIQTLEVPKVFLTVLS